MQGKYYIVILLSIYWLFNSIEPLNWNADKSCFIEKCRLFIHANSESNLPYAWTKEIHGKVIKISDGDTFTMIFENNFDVKVRLNGIDCPEKSQPFSNKAKQALSNFIFGKTVIVRYTTKDGFGRVIGDVFVDGLNINKEMVRLGWAWHFKRYSDDKELDSLETDAKENKRGLWFEQNPIPPWDWRKGVRN